MKETLTFNKNIELRKRLIAIANFVGKNSLASALSLGSKVLTPKQEITNTKKASVMIPLLSGIKDVKEVLTQFKNGGITLTEFELNEFIVELSNEKITEPKLWRPKDGEYLTEQGAADLLGRYQESKQITATIAKDKEFLKTLYFNTRNGITAAVGIAGNDKKLKGSVVELKYDDTKSVEWNGKEIAQAIEIQLDALIETKDRLIAGELGEEDFNIVLPRKFVRALDANGAYNIRTDAMIKSLGYDKYGSKVKFQGEFRGATLFTSKYLPDNSNGFIMLKGSATSIFALKKHLNVDKAIGVNAYAVSLEFDLGSGVFLPHMITLFSKDTSTLPVQTRRTFDELILDVQHSITTSGNAANSAGIGDGATYEDVLTKQELADMTIDQLKKFAKTNNITLAQTTKANILAEIKTAIQ